MKSNILLGLLLAGACGAKSKVAAPTPAPVAESIARYIGEYYAEHDTLFVRESNGRLEGVLKRVAMPLQTFNGDTFVFGGRKIVIGADEAEMNGMVFTRRPIAAGTFRITPVRPIAQLRAEALAAAPPPQSDTLRKPDLVELHSLEPGLEYDIRYATTNNFMSEVFYASAHAFLQRPAAEAVVRAHRKLAAQGYGLLVHDAYRPWYVTQMFWDATPDSLRDYVADPSKGSRHNRGAAIDITLYDLRTGQPVEMPGGYDEFSERSSPTFPGGTTHQRQMRDLLRRTMEAEGFSVYPYEWWHFDFNGWQSYPVLNARFEELRK